MDEFSFIEPVRPTTQYTVQAGERQAMSRNPNTKSDAADADRRPARQNELHLIARIAHGDIPAFEQLYRLYFPRLMRFLGRMTRRPAIVEELVNDTMLVVLQKAGTFNGTAKLSTWIFAIAYRKALKALRDLDEPIESDGKDVVDSNGHEPRDHLLQQQMRALLSTAVHALTAEHRAVIELTYFHGADYREIAQIMDCPVATIKTRMFYARRRLKTLLPCSVEDVL